MKILYVTTVGMTMNFFYKHFRHLLSQGHSVELACSDSWDYSERVAALGLKRYNIPFSRSPLSASNLSAYRQFKDLVEKNDYDIVHCHTPVAAAITRLACRKLRKKGLRIIYTAHGFHFYSGAPLKNWLLFYPVEKLCAHFTDTLITINREDYERASRSFAVETVYIPGVGIEPESFAAEAEQRRSLREELGIPCGATLIISVGELSHRKNHETAIRAMAALDGDCYFLIAGSGDRLDSLAALAGELGLSDRVKLLGYRTDVARLYSAADIYLHPAFQEGLPVAVMEAMASSLPCAVSKIRGNVDLIDENGGALFDPSSAEACAEAIKRILKADREALGRYNREKIRQFSTKRVLERLDEVYGV